MTSVNRPRNVSASGGRHRKTGVPMRKAPYLAALAVVGALLFAAPAQARYDEHGVASVCGVSRIVDIPNGGHCNAIPGPNGGLFGVYQIAITDWSTTGGAGYCGGLYDWNWTFHPITCINQDTPSPTVWINIGMSVFSNYARPGVVNYWGGTKRIYGVVDSACGPGIWVWQPC